MAVNGVNYNNALEAYARSQAAAKAAASKAASAEGMGTVPSSKTAAPSVGAAPQWQPAVLRQGDDLRPLQQLTSSASSQEASFAGVVGEFARSQAKKVRQGEMASRRATVGDIDKVELVALVSEAETALKLAQTLCSKMVSSFKELIQTPL